MFHLTFAQGQMQPLLKQTANLLVLISTLNTSILDSMYLLVIACISFFTDDLVLDSSARSRELDLMIFTGPFQLEIL